jgi:hypothetical protein
MKVWIESSMVRVRRGDSPPAHPATPTLAAARGEWESFQIVIQGPARNVRVETSFSGLSVELFRQHYIEIKEGTKPWEWDNTTPRTALPEPPGWIPDALVPFVDPVTGKPPEAGARFVAQPFDVAEGENQPVWVDIFVPRNARAGRVRGSWRVTSDGGKVAGTVALRVRNFTVPLGPTLQSSMNLWNHRTKPDRELLLRHRLMPLDVPPDEVPEWRKKYGLAQSNLGFWSGAGYSVGKMKPAPSLEEVKAQKARYPAGFALYDYSVDEIGHHKHLYPEVTRWGERFHQIGVRHLAVMEPMPELFSAVDIWVLQPNYYYKSPKNVEAARKAGAQLWCYTALNQDPYSPKWLLDFAPAHHRMFHGFLSQVYGFTGVLYWAMDFHKTGIRYRDGQKLPETERDPWTDPTWRSDDNGNYPSEGLLIYPGKDCGCTATVPSLRLKWIRAGVQDYEYVAMLKKRGKEKQAMALVRKIARSYKDWSSDPRAMEAIRHALGDLLERSPK